MILRQIGHEMTIRKRRKYLSINERCSIEIRHLSSTRQTGTKSNVIFSDMRKLKLCMRRAVQEIDLIGILSVKRILLTIGICLLY
jgi:hypothetical protein